jgi:uncharacterized membrane protein YciS (DUF1049 family)
MIECVVIFSVLVPIFVFTTFVLGFILGWRFSVRTYMEEKVIDMNSAKKVKKEKDRDKDKEKKKKRDAVEESV